MSERYKFLRKKRVGDKWVEMAPEESLKKKRLPKVVILKKGGSR